MSFPRYDWITPAAKICNDEGFGGEFLKTFENTHEGPVSTSR